MKARAYRIYDKTTKQMLYPKDLARMAVFLDPTGTPVQYKGGNRFAKLDNVVVMYDTGLPTQSGTPIWEADILNVSIPTEFGSLIPTRGFMQWDRLGGIWSVQIPNPPVLAPVGQFPVINGEVVGNLYQHPDMLHMKP